MQFTNSIFIFLGDRRKLQASLSWRVRSNDQHVAADQQEVQRCDHQAGKRNRAMTSIWIFRFYFVRLLNVYGKSHSQALSYI